MPVDGIEAEVGLWKTLMAAGRMAYMAGNFKQAASEYRQALQLGMQIDSIPPLQSEALIQLAVCMSGLKQFQDADDLLHKALGINTADPEVDYVLLASNRHELAVLFWRTARSSEALQMADAALNDLDRSPQDVAELRVSILKHKAVLLSSNHRYEEARQLLDLAENTALRSSDLGRNSMAYGQVLVTKALLCLDEGRMEDAQKIYSEAKQIVEMSWGAHNPKIAELCEIFSSHTRAAGMEKDADKFDEAALALRNWIKKYGVG